MPGLRLVIPALVLLGGVAWQINGLWNGPSNPLSTRHDNGLPASSAMAPLATAQAADILTPRSDADTPAAPAAPVPLAPKPAPSPPPAAQPPAAATPPAQTAEQVARPVVDETALRYFAREGDTRRLNTEIARLRSLYPDWVPPDDPLKAAPIADPQLDALWQLYSQGQFAAARAAIVARQGNEPSWAPPKDLLDRLAVAETRERLVNASNAKQNMTVIELATVTPSLLTCGDVDVLWRVAEAFAQTDRLMRAQDAYRYILTACTDPHDRLSTMQKAMTQLPRPELEPLLALGHTGSDGDEFRSIREGLARNAIVAAVNDAKANVDAADLKLLADIAKADSAPADALLLGGYFRGHNDPAQAEQWYRLAYQRQNSAPAAEGLALALIGLKRSAEAEALLAPWHDTNEGTRKSYMAAIANLLAQQPPPMLAPDVLSRVAAAVAAQRDPASAQQLGWYAHFYRQEETAARWFAAALSWKPDDEPSAYGLAIANLAMNRRDIVRSLVNAWGPHSPRIRALLDPVLARELALAGTQANQAGPVPWTPGMPQSAQASPSPLAVSPPPAVPVQAPQQPVAMGTAPAMMPPSPAPQGMPAPQPQAIAPMERTPVRSASRQRQRVAAPMAAAPSGRGGCTGGLAGGWCLMKLDRPSEAVIAFQNALASGSAQQRQDAAYGLSLAYLRLGLTSQAAAASTQASQPTGRARELNLSILTQRILSDYQGGRYSETLMGLDSRARLAPEQTDLLMVRGWSYFHLQRFAEARRVFEAVAATGNSAAAGAVEAVREATRSRN